MNKFQLSKKSWHWWLASRHGNFRDYADNTEIDLCTYTRHVAKGMSILCFLVLLGSVMASIILIPLADFIAYFFGSVSYGSFLELTELSFTGALVILFMLGMFTATMVSEQLAKRRDRHSAQVAQKNPENPGFFSLQAMRLKEKTCVMLEINS